MSQTGSGSQPTDGPEEPEGRLQLTSALTLAVGLLCGLVLAWLGSLTIDAFGGVLPAAPPAFAILLASVAVPVVFYARSLKRRIADQGVEVKPTEGLAALVFGKSMAILGAILVGAMLVYVPDLGGLQYPLPRRRVVMAGATIAAALVFGGAGLILERACRAPGTPGDDTGGAAAAS